MSSNTQIKQELKELIISSLNLEDITPADIVDEDPLFVDGLGLDSIDALELGLAIKKQFNVTIPAESADNKQHFASINALAAYIESCMAR